MARPSPIPPWVLQAALILVPFAAVSLVASRYRHTWYFFDEWSMITRALYTPNVLNGATEAYNGHLYAVCYFVYRAQLAIGLNGHAFVWTVFCIVLLATNVAIALTLWAGRVPALVAVIAGAVVTYFGPGAQLSTFEILFTWDGAIAFALFAGYVVLRARKTQRMRAAVSVAVLLLIALAFDSATAYGGIIFIATLVLVRWRDRYVFLALAPPVAAGIAFQLSAGGMPQGSSILLFQDITFCFHLLLLAAGGLVGAGEIAGGFLLGFTFILLAYATVHRYLSGSPVHLLIAGGIAAVVLALSMAFARVTIVGNNFVDYNRYIAVVGVYVLVALLPALFAAGRGITETHDNWRPRESWLTPVVSVLLIVVFLLNLRPFTQYRDGLEQVQQETRVLVAQMSSVLVHGCPPRTTLALAAEPLGTLDPQVYVELIRQLQSDRSLSLAGQAQQLLKAYPVPSVNLSSLHAIMCQR